MSHRYREPPGDPVAALRAAAADGLAQAGALVMARAVAVTPLEEGTLRRSARVSVDRDALEAAISYDTVYAARQHEEMTWRHTDGQAKYLERPLVESSGDVARVVAAAVRARIGG